MIGGQLGKAYSRGMNRCTKRGRNEYAADEVEEENRLKGVVSQEKGGHWGAQIYAKKHQRIWLGTFKSQTEAVMAYDSATIKLRSETHPWNDEEVQFQSHYSVETVLTMIRNGTYQSKFATFQSSSNHNVSGEKFWCTQLLLFRKELTPSDVGKLNRLVIPKKHALTYFPCNDIEVVFYDKLMRLWKFRYCYWKSSQSYVFTRGWNRFVKDKKLKAGDVIAFYTHHQLFSLIDVIYHSNSNSNGNAVADDDQRRRQYCFGEEEQILGINKLISSTDQVEEEGQDRMDLNGGGGGLRLFGVSIN